jgi:SAM-dependent methyltransferase
VRICARCASGAVDASWSCGACGFAPSCLQGFTAFAPDAALDDEGFEETFFPELARIEEGHFWFRARNALITWALRCQAPTPSRILEVGCGTGFVLRRLAAEFPGATLVGSDLFPGGLEYAAKRVPAATCLQLDARHVPYRDEFDVIGAFDVLEHIPDDRAVVDALAAALVPGGALAVTVPQHPALWSRQDDHAHHVRRYTRRRLHGLLAAAGLEVALSTSFVSLLLPAMLASRLGIRRSAEPLEGVEALEVPAPLNGLFAAVMTVERLLIRAGVAFPAGGSLLVVARRPLPSVSR